MSLPTGAPQIRNQGSIFPSNSSAANFSPSGVRGVWEGNKIISRQLWSFLTALGPLKDSQHTQREGYLSESNWTDHQPKNPRPHSRLKLFVSMSFPISVNMHSKNLRRGVGWGGTMGENHSFWLLKRFLIFQGISGDLDANLLKHISLKIQ